MLSYFITYLKQTTAYYYMLTDIGVKLNKYFISITMVEKVAKQHFFLSVLSLLCLILSLSVFYPLSMEVDKYSNLALTLWAYSFYILQGISFILALISFVKTVSLTKQIKRYQFLISLIINAMVFATFGYEMYWLLKRI